MKKVLITATVQSHIAQFHKPLIGLLKENGYEVHVAARNNLGEKNGLDLDSPDRIYNVPFDRSPLSKVNLFAYKELKNIISKNDYEIIHCNTPMGGVITRLAARYARKNGTKVFYTAHGFHFYQGSPVNNWLIYYPIEKWLAYHTDKLITITKEDYRLASHRFRTDVFHVHGVGADSDKYFPYSREDNLRLRSNLGYSENEFIFLCTGELNKNKNQSTVIKALAKVIDDVPNVKLLLAGNGSNEERLKDLVADLSLEGYVHFLGYRTDLERYVNICDAVISASYREGLPVNIMEAMLCRKPVIASVNRGHTELIENGKNGILVKPNDVLGFSDTIIRIVKDKDLQKFLSTNGFDSVQKYIKSSIVGELRKIYGMI